MTPAMEAIFEASKHLCQMACDAGLPSDAEERLRSTLAVAGVIAMSDPSFAAWLKDAVAGFLGTFVDIAKKVEDLEARLQPTRPASALPTALAGLRGDRLFRVLTALTLPANAATNVQLEVALVAQHLVQHDAIHGITNIYQKVISEGNTEAAFGETTYDFVRRRLTLDAFVQKHIDLADADAPSQAN